MQELTAAQTGALTPENTIQISIRGRWFNAPSLRVNGQTLVTTRKHRIRIATLNDEEWIEEQVRDPGACIRALKDRSTAARADIFAFSQRAPDVTPRYSYPMELRSIAVARVGNLEEWRGHLPSKTRQNIRRAEKQGVVLKVRGLDPDVVEGIRQVQNETPVRQGRPFPHYGKTFEQVQRDHGSFVDHSDFICAYFGEEFIGFLKLVYLGEVASLMQMLPKVAFYEKRTADAMLAKAAELSSARGARYLTYGLFNYGNKGDSSLRLFKERHGFGEMLVPYYYAPVTAWGGFCVKTGLYRGWHDILPHSAIQAATGLRAWWYARRSR